MVCTPLPTDCSARDDQLDHLSNVISSLIVKLDGNPAASVSVRRGADFCGFTAISSGDEVKFQRVLLTPYRSWINLRSGPP